MHRTPYYQVFILHQACRQAGNAQVNGEQVKLQHPMSKQRKAFLIKLILGPVGALVGITGTAQLSSLVSCILTILEHIHERYFVHRNIWLDNVVRVTNGWLLGTRRENKSMSLAGAESAARWGNA